MMVTSLKPIRLRHLINKFVFIELQEGLEVRGVLTAVDCSNHGGGLGNLFVQTENGTSLIRGDAVQTVKWRLQ